MPRSLDLEIRLACQRRADLGPFRKRLVPVAQETQVDDPGSVSREPERPREVMGCTLAHDRLRRTPGAGSPKRPGLERVARRERPDSSGVLGDELDLGPLVELGLEG